MWGTRKGFGNVEKTYVTSFRFVMQFHKEVHGLLRGGEKCRVGQPLQTLMVRLSIHGSMSPTTTLPYPPLLYLASGAGQWDVCYTKLLLWASWQIIICVVP